MEVTRRRGGTVDWEGLWNRMADRAMGKKRPSTANYPQTAWELVKPILATGWHTHAELKRQTGRHIAEALICHKAELRKRGKHQFTEYRLRKP